MEMIKNNSALDRNFKGKVGLQKFGGFLAKMVMPNIGAFIAWGIITAFFMPKGWIPNASLNKLVNPMAMYLLPLLIGYTGSKLVHDQRGGVVGAIATAGIIVGSSIPMFLGAMIMGPLGGWLIKKFDDFTGDKIPSGFEMIVDNFSAGIIGAILAIFAYVFIEPVVQGVSTALGSAADIVTKHGLLPLISIVIEPGKVLFLNDVINHGILSPLGIQQAKETGKSIFFLLETDPGPGLGVLTAYWLYGRGSAKQSAPGAIIIQFLGGIHEIYFPYVLMKPFLLIAVIGGGMAADLTFVLLKAGLVAVPSPGSIFAEMAMAPKGGLFPVLLGIAAGAGVSFIIASFIIRTDRSEIDDKSLNKKIPELIVFACDAGIGLSAMGESILKKKILEAGLKIDVKHSSIDQIPANADVVFTLEKLAERALKAAPGARIIAVKNLLDNTIYDEYVGSLKKLQ